MIEPLRDGLVWSNLPGGRRQIKCQHCHSTVSAAHQPASEPCYENRIEREIGHGDE